jgi:hypothetical protein
MEPFPYIQRFLDILEEYLPGGHPMNAIIYIVGLVVIIGLVLSFLGFR